MRIPAKTENLSQVISYIDETLENADCPMKVQMQIELSVEELFTNIASYAYADGKGDVDIAASVSPDGIASVTFIDSGVPYDPLKKQDPDITLSAENRQIGGLGIFLVKKNMDTVDYRYTNGQNCLTVTKKIR